MDFSVSEQWHMSHILNARLILFNDSNSMFLSFFSAILIGSLIKLNGFTLQ